MAKKKDPVEPMTPDELTELKKTVGEFMQRLQNVDNEIDSLKEDRKNLISEFKEKLDMKTLQMAIKLVKIEASVEHKDTFDTFVEVLKDDETNGLTS